MMNERRKQIILSEIDYWKRNNLLPAHYCDFLSTLYTGGEEEEEEGKPRTSSVLYKEKRNQRIKVSLIALLSVAVAVVIYLLNDFSSLLIGAGSIVVLLVFTLFNSVKKSTMLPFVYIASAFLLLTMSLKIWSLYFMTQPILLIGLLILNCVMWLFAGRLLKLLYFTLSGALGLIAIIFSIFIQF